MSIRACFILCCGINGTNWQLHRELTGTLCFFIASIKILSTSLMLSIHSAPGPITLMLVPLSVKLLHSAQALGNISLTTYPFVGSTDI